MIVTRVRLVIGALVVAVVALATGLVIVLAGESPSMTGGGSMMGGSAMMGTMTMTPEESAAMVAHLKEVLGEDGFRRLQEHYRAGSMDGMTGMTGMTEMDRQMHTMMAQCLAQAS